jgi:hypothetical protein
MYACNMHHIFVRPLPLSASGRHNHSKRRGRRTSAPRPGASPCAGGASRRHRVRACARRPRVASSRERKRSPHVAAAVPTPSGRAGGRAGAAAKGGPMERKDSTKQAAGRATAVVVDHAGIHGSASEWRSRLGEWIFFYKLLD